MEQLVGENGPLIHRSSSVSEPPLITGRALAQLRAVGPAETTKEALADWEYWVKHGYQF